jgi:hypothetical protein
MSDRTTRWIRVPNRVGRARRGLTVPKTKRAGSIDGNGDDVDLRWNDSPIDATKASGCPGTDPSSSRRQAAAVATPAPAAGHSVPGPSRPSRIDLRPGELEALARIAVSRAHPPRMCTSTRCRSASSVLAEAMDFCTCPSRIVRRPGLNLGVLVEPFPDEPAHFVRSFERPGRLARALDFSAQPFLTEPVNHARQIAPERLAELVLDLALDEARDGFDAVERGRDVDFFERVVLEHEGDALLARDDEDDDGAEGEVREAEGHRDDERRGGKQDAGRVEDVERRSGHIERVGLFSRKGREGP